MRHGDRPPSPSRVRRLTRSLGPIAGWAALWGVLHVAGWRPRPVGLLAALVLVMALARLVSALAAGVGALPRVELRAPSRSPVGEDSRLVRHQLHLEDAAADPPSCRPVLAHIAVLTRERLRLVHGIDTDPQRPGRPGPPPTGAPAALLGERLSALLVDPPPDRTRLAPRELTRLVDELEAL
jgi:hypothetical protein